MKNKWNYQGLGQVKYGKAGTYQAAVEWLDEVGGSLEDWGCGCAYAKGFVKKSRYIGIEGSKNDFADRCDVDLREYKSEADSILLKHVLDHNPEWKKIIQNAIDSFRQRMVIIFLRNWGKETKIVLTHGDPKYPGVNDLQFRKEDVLEFVGPYLVKEEHVPPNEETPNHCVLLYLQK